MTTITINKRTKAGKLILKWQSLSEKEKGVVISEDENHAIIPRLRRS
jgi:hypothetical protein